MKIVFFSAFNQGYLNDFLNRTPNISELDYNTILKFASQDQMGAFSTYTHYANSLGHETYLIVSNFEYLQHKWAKENDIIINSDWQFSIAFAQIKKIKPDVFFMGSLFHFYGEFLEKIKPYCAKIIGWVACPIPSKTKFNQFNLILSSAKHYVDNFRKLGINSELLPAAFDKRIWDDFVIQEKKRDIEFSFVGGLSKIHKDRIEFVRKIASKSKIKIWSGNYESNLNWLEKLLFGDPILNALVGHVWGKEMFSVYGKSKIAFNLHIGESKNQAGNMRMYEVTGMGALLLSDKKEDDQNLWINEKEFVEYTSIDDAIEKINYYLRNEKERIEIAKAGQLRTHTMYNYQNVTKLMLEYFNKL